MEWLADETNGIGEMLASVFRAKEALCIHDTCVNEDQLKSLLSGQSAAAGVPSSGAASGGASGPSVQEASSTDPATIPDNDDGAAAVATSSLEVGNPANDNRSAASAGDDEDDAQQDAGEPEAQPDEVAPTHVPAPLDEGNAHKGTTPPEPDTVPISTPEPDPPAEAANDNEPVVELSATGTE
jgi:hypothetical protein